LILIKLFLPGQDAGIRTEEFGYFSVQGFNVQMSYPLSSEIFGEKQIMPKSIKQKGSKK
jgi:hypothetical protein